MFQKSGYELILGSSSDPQMGPVLMFGAGGSLVEIMNDRAWQSLPSTVRLLVR